MGLGYKNWLEKEKKEICVVGWLKMDLESVKRYLEKGSSVVDGLPPRFLEPLIMNALNVDLIEPGRVVCSMKIPSRLLVRTLTPILIPFLLLFSLPLIFQFDGFCLHRMVAIRYTVAPPLRSSMSWAPPPSPPLGIRLPVLGFPSRLMFPT